MGRKGLTIIELLSVLTIIGTLAGISVPKLREIVYVAQVAKAIGDLRVIGQEIDAVVAGGGALPADLSAIGRGGWLDPWGNPYQYLPFPVGKGGASQVPREKTASWCPSTPNTTSTAWAGTGCPCPRSPPPGAATTSFVPTTVASSAWPRSTDR